MGASRPTVFTVILLEAVTIAAIGTLVGFLVFAVIMSATVYLVREQTGVVLNVFQFDSMWIFTPLLMIAVGAIAGIIPAFKAYGTDVAENLSPTS